MNPNPVFLPFPGPLLVATFLARRKRFFADVRLADGTETSAHCPNTGSMKGCLFPGHRALLWDSQNPGRRLRYTWKAVEADGFWVGVDTAVPNRLVEAAVKAQAIPGLRGFPRCCGSARWGSTAAWTCSSRARPAGATWRSRT